MPGKSSCAALTYTGRPMRRPVHWASGLLLWAFTTIVVVARPSVHARQQSDQSAPQAAREARRTVSDGVYTSEQALRGQAVVEAHCVECHGEDRPAKGSFDCSRLMPTKSVSSSGPSCAWISSHSALAARACSPSKIVAATMN